MSFRFKQFSIDDSKCAMKVGTDGVLLGAWCPISRNEVNRALAAENIQSPISNTPYRVLDVGTGSGLIARMVMQRCPEAEVEAIDIDPAAVAQARENGVNAFCSSLQDWPLSTLNSPLSTFNYDIVVSNPPYFQNSLKNPDKGRQTARHTDTLSYAELIHHSARLLTNLGQLSLILPAEAETEVRQLAAAENLFLTRLTRVYSKESKPARRVLMAFIHCPLTRHPSPLTSSHAPLIDSLILEDEKGGRSLPYQNLCQEFYL